MMRRLPFPKQQPALSLRARQRLSALSRWDNEGGAGPSLQQLTAASDDSSPPWTGHWNTEATQLRTRVIALENLVIALLAGANDHQLTLARVMAAYISPRPGFTHHRLTIHAARQMRHLGARALHFRVAVPATPDD